MNNNISNKNYMYYDNENILNRGFCMKVIGINGSARKGGNTAILINTVFEELENKGIEIELIELADKENSECLNKYR